MHEMGIILHMANMLDETAKEQNLTKIGNSIRLVVWKACKGGKAGEQTIYRQQSGGNSADSRT